MTKLRRESFGGMFYNYGKDPAVEKLLNETATRILELCTGHLTEDEIADILEKEFEGSKEKVHRDLKKFLTDFEKDDHINYEETLEPSSITHNPWNGSTIKPALEAPVEVAAYLTNTCNMHCLHCNAESGEALPDELKIKEWKDIIADLASMNVFRVIITGGEPLCRKDVFKIISLMTSNSVVVHLNTNGTLIGSNVARKLKNVGVRMVSVSIDGGSPNSHERLRGVTGSFNKALMGAKACVDAGLVVTLNFTVNSLNYREIRGFLDLSRSWGVSGVKFFFVLGTGRANDHPSILLTNDQLEHAYETVLKESCKDGTILCEPWVIRSSSYATSAREPCGAATYRCSITANGFVTPCTFFPPSDIELDGEIIRSDNVRSMSIKEIWRRSRYLNIFRTSDCLEEPCSACNLKDCCCGGCRVNAMLHFGSPAFGDPRCPKVLNHQRSKT